MPKPQKPSRKPSGKKLELLPKCVELIAFSRVEKGMCTEQDASLVMDNILKSLSPMEKELFLKRHEKKLKESGRG